MKEFFIALIPLLLISCATVHKTYAPNGKEAFSLNCSGTARGWDKCLNAAGELCGAQGYRILDRSDESMASISGGSSAYVGGSSSSFYGSGSSGFYGVKTNERSMLITCGQS